MRDDEREVQLFFAGTGQDFRRVGDGGSEHFGRLRVLGGLGGQGAAEVEGALFFYLLFGWSLASC